MKVEILVKAILPSGLDEDETDLEYLIEQIGEVVVNITGNKFNVEEIK